jgi:hypothetical protein
MRMDTRIGAAKYPIKTNRPGYVSQAYPTRIRIRYTPDTGYEGCLKYPRFLVYRCRVANYYLKTSLFISASLLKKPFSVKQST